MKILSICGSRNPKGQTARAAEAVLEGAAKAGAEAERVFLPTLALERCRQCDDSGWGLCRREGRCVIGDDLGGVVERLRQADAVVVSTPVYYSDLSEGLRAFTDRLRRTCTHEAGRASIKGKPALGVCVAGGGGGGACPSAFARASRRLTRVGRSCSRSRTARRVAASTTSPGL